MNDEIDREDLDAWDVEPLGGDFEERVLAAWSDEQAEDETETSGWLLAWTPVLAFAAAVVLIVILWPRTEAYEPKIAIRAGASAQVDYTPGSGRANQRSGTVTYEVPSGTPFVVHTPAADVTVHGTVFTVEMLKMKDPMRQKFLGAGALAMAGAAVAVYVTAGEVEVRNGEGAVRLNPGQTAVAAEHLAPRIEPRPTLAKAPVVAPASKAVKRAKRVSTQQRAEARRRIQQALEHTEHAPARDDDTLDSDESSEGSLDKEYIREVVKEDLVPLAKECYESALVDSPDLAGAVMVKFSISGDASVGGVVDEVELVQANMFSDPEAEANPPPPGTKIDQTPPSAKRIPEFPTAATPDFVECLEESTASLLLDPPKGGGRVVVRYPFVFEPK